MAAPRDIVLGQNGPAEPRLDAEERKRASRHGLAHDDRSPCPPRSIGATANVDAAIPRKTSVVPLRRSSMFGCDIGLNPRPPSVS